MSEQEKDVNTNPYHVYYDNYLDTDASTECTGLIPALALNYDEREHYRQIFNYTREVLSTPEKHSTEIHSD